MAPPRSTAACEGVTVPVIVHLCYGYPGGASLQHHYTYPELLDRLMQTRIAGFTVEFARSTYDPAILKPYRERLFMFGCIDPGNTPAPTVDDVKRRIAGALDYLDPARRDARARLRADDHQPRARAREARGHGRGGARSAEGDVSAQNSSGQGSIMAHSSGPLLHPLHLRREAALAADPVLHRRRVVGHQVGGAGVARHLDAERIGLVEIGRVEAEACLRRHANLVQRHDAQHQRAGGIADAVDDDPLAAVADLRVLGLVLIDQPAEIARDAIVRLQQTRSPARAGPTQEAARTEFPRMSRRDKR